jgi:tetratricopeptide (TPR) repeat protein
MGISRLFSKIFVLPSLMKDAAIEFQKDNFNQAINIYLKVIRLHPNYYDAHLWAGTAYFAIEQNNKAIECYQKAIEINIKGFDAYYNFSQLELKENRYENSLKLMLKAIEYTPFKSENFSNLYYRKGLLEYYLFNYQEALQSFNKSLEFMPSNNEAQNGRSMAAEGILSEYRISN